MKKMSFYLVLFFSLVFFSLALSGLHRNHLPLRLSNLAQPLQLLPPPPSARHPSLKIESLPIPSRLISIAKPTIAAELDLPPASSAFSTVF